MKFSDEQNPLIKFNIRVNGKKLCEQIGDVILISSNSLSPYSNSTLNNENSTTIAYFITKVCAVKSPRNRL